MTSKPARPAVWSVVIGALVLVVLMAVTVVIAFRVVTDDSRRDYLGTDDWPTSGQAAIVIGDGPARTGPSEWPAPIASLAKVMTAYLVLSAYPLSDSSDGFRFRITADDVELTRRQRAQQQSLVAVRDGEWVTQRQALMGLLLPSANNMAVFLARRVAGSVAAFVARMNATARRLGMRRTHYADPSGFDPHTVSTAGDQLRLARTMADNRVFTTMSGTRSYALPVAGTVENTDVLLGRDGFVGTKTGSHDAAGGCFMFRAERRVDGRHVTVLGVVMGQRGRDLALAGQYAARQLVRSRTTTP